MNRNLPAGAIACPIWGTPSYLIEGYAARDGIAVHSARAGGRYFISRSAAVSLHSYADDIRVKLTHEIVDHNSLGSILEILTTTIEGMERVALSRPLQRSARLLRYLIKESKFLGQTVSFPFDLKIEESGVYVGVRSEPSAEHDAIFAWSDSLVADEVVFLLRMLASDDLISLGENGPIPDVVVEPKGYEAAAASDSSQSDQAFVAMWFDPSMTQAYELGIEAAVRECGYRPLRIDQKEHINKIDDEIIAEIKRSRFLIADFTAAPGCPRGGVYFEAGYAYALGKPVIWTCQEHLIGEVHFDTRQFNHIVWRDADELKKRLKNRIGAILGDGPFRQ